MELLHTCTLPELNLHPRLHTFVPHMQMLWFENDLKKAPSQIHIEARTATTTTKIQFARLGYIFCENKIFHIVFTIWFVS